MRFFQDDHIYYGIGTDQQWRRITRDLIIDMQKGWALQDRPKRRSPRNKFKVQVLILKVCRYYFYILLIFNSKFILSGSEVKHHL